MSTNQDTGALYGLIVEFDDVPDLMVEYTVPSPYPDVNNNQFVSPIDALTVIGYSNSLVGGEGEAVLAPTTLASSPTVATLRALSFSGRLIVIRRIPPVVSTFRFSNCIIISLNVHVSESFY